MTSNKLYSEYFIKDSRGYNFIRRFYDRYQDELQTIAYNSFDSLLNHIILVINTIELPKITKNEEVYLSGLIKVQCRALIDQILKLKSSDNETNNDQQVNNSPKTRDVFKRISEFKLQLAPKELTIFNSIIDEETREDLTEEGINTDSYQGTIKKLKSRFITYLKELGYNYNTFFTEKKVEPLDENG
ncbi:MAG TPA: hypothetical protein VLM39_08935 [Ignavibacteriaceae bacterium]|nr:hypothetical protein [Ignavibacteriaceae bacterium]